MAALFVCVFLFVMLSEIPVVGDIMLIILFICVLWFVGSVFVEYNDIVAEREASISIQKIEYACCLSNIIG